MTKFINAPIEANIIGSEFINDRLFVFFDNESIYELIKHDDKETPFSWRKIDLSVENFPLPLLSSEKKLADL